MSAIDHAFIKAYGQQDRVFVVPAQEAAASTEPGDSVSDEPTPEATDEPDGPPGQSPAEAGTDAGDDNAPGHSASRADELEIAGRVGPSEGLTPVDDAHEPPEPAPPPEPGAEADDEAITEPSPLAEPADEADDEPTMSAEPAGELAPSAEPNMPIPSELESAPCRDEPLPLAVSGEAPAETALSEDDSEGSEEGPLRPSYQVDSLAWPSGCTRVSMVASDQVDRLADALMTGRERGQHVVALSGCCRGDGCTTLLLCAARRLAERGLNVLIIDADFAGPLLARRLGLVPETGWEEVLAGRLAVGEVIIESIQDRLAVMPLCGSLPSGACPAEGLADPKSSLRSLREHYDLVLVDLGALGEQAADDNALARPVLDWIDAVVLVHNVRATPQAELHQARDRLRAAGLVELGIAENFVDLRRSA